MLSLALVLVCLDMGLVDKKYSRTERLRTRRRQKRVLQGVILATVLLLRTRFHRKYLHHALRF
jgi:hypothetical protein